MVAVFTVILAATEVVLAYYSAVLGAAIHAILVGGLLLQYVSAPSSNARLSGTGLPLALSSRLLPVVAQLSLLRLLSLVMPIEQISEIYWYAMVGLPVLVGSVMTARIIGFTRRDLGLTPKFGRPDIAIAASGIPLGLIGYLIARPDIEIDTDAWTTLILTSLFIIVFSGFLEEFLFRGLLQNVAVREFGKFAIVWSSVIFGIMYLGSQSLQYALFMGGCGLLFGWCYSRTLSLWSVVIAHALLSLGLLVVFPLILNG